MHSAAHAVNPSMHETSSDKQEAILAGMDQDGECSCGMVAVKLMTAAVSTMLLHKPLYPDYESVYH